VGIGRFGLRERVDLAGKPDLSDCLTPEVLDSLVEVSGVACHTALMIAVCNGQVWVWGGIGYPLIPELAMPLEIDVEGSQFQGSCTPLRVGDKLKGHTIMTVSCSKINIVAIIVKGRVYVISAYLYMLFLHT
jgi:hypothetical protein